MKQFSYSKWNTLARLRKWSCLRLLTVSALLPGLGLWTSLPVGANPSGGIVVNGDVSIGSGTGGYLTINQASHSAIVDWNSFSIAAGETTEFIQPGTSAAILNRVTGGDPTAIHGALQANGNVFVINPNGILVGAGGTIDVHGIVLSTLDVSNGEFLERGDMVFEGASDKGVVNMGRINAIGGDVFLLGKTIHNSGSISAANGTVGLGAGEEVLLTAGEDRNGERMFVRATGAGASGTGIFNDGTIEGAAIELKSHGNAYALAINNKGSIRATGVSNHGGRVTLHGAGGSIHNSGSVAAYAPSSRGSASVLIKAAYARVEGEIRATSGTDGGAVKIASENEAEIGGSINVSGDSGVGGEVIVEASKINLTASSDIDASGFTGGGSVNIGGGFQGKDSDITNAQSVVVEAGSRIAVDALASGDAGTAVIWSDGDTLFGGEISATGVSRGGLVEVSGKERLGFDGVVSTLAADGSAGMLLLDPRNGFITTGTHDPTGSPFVIKGSTLEGALGSSNVVISTFDTTANDAGNISVEDQIRWSSDFSLTLLAEGDIYVGNDILNQNGGNVNLVAGWDQSKAPLGIGDGVFYNVGSDVNMADDIFAVADSFGKNMGSVYIGSLGAPDVSANTGVAVGSRTGEVNVAAYDVNVWAMPTDANNSPRMFSSIGYERTNAGTPASSPITGSIRVEATNDVSIVSNRFAVGAEGYPGWNDSPTELAGNRGYNAYAQIGHGGREALRTSSMSGSITVKAGRDVIAQAGHTRENYVMIGHGGYDNKQGLNDTFTAPTSTATIGLAPISVTAGRNVEVTGGLGSAAFAQIGNGGLNHVVTDFTASSIDVTAAGDILFNGGSGGVSNGTSAYAQLGHGGYDSDLTDTAVAAGQGFAGNITVNAGGAIDFQGGDNTGNYVQLGNGGYSTVGNHSGTILVNNISAGAGGVMFSGGSGNQNYAQLGHGGYAADGNQSGSITVKAGIGGVVFKAGGGTASYAQLGNGGYATDGNHGLAIDVNTSGAVNFTAGGGAQAYAQLGHGGYSAKGDHSGTVDVVAGVAGIDFDGGDGGQAYVQIGHGGYEADGDHGSAIDVSSGGAVSFSASDGDNSYARVGHGGDLASGDIDASVDVSGTSITFEGGGGYFSSAHIGHGGRDAVGDFEGAITVDAGSGALMFTGGGWDGTGAAGYSWAQIGHGGFVTLGAHGGLIDVDAGVIAFTGGTSAQSYAQIGHGGYNSDSSHVGSIDVESTMGSITFHAGTGANNTYAQIGHGGSESQGDNGDVNGTDAVDRIANIKVVSAGGLDFQGGDLTNAYVQIGHGGVNTDGSKAGNISVEGAGDIDFIGGTGTLTKAHIGHGGYRADATTISGNIEVITSGTGGLTFSAGRGNQSSSQIGHGGYESDGDISGTIDVESGTGGIAFTATPDSGYFAHAMIGHGGRDVGRDGPGNKEGKITVSSAGGGITLTAGGVDEVFQYAHAQIGHGGYGNIMSGDVSGDIMVTANGGGGLSVLGGSTYGAYAMVGHGGFGGGQITGTTSGNVLVTADADILVDAGDAQSYSFAQIGHGGRNNDGDMGLDGERVSVISRSGNIELLAGEGADNIALIGHGDNNDSSGARRGDIFVDARNGELTLVSQTSNLAWIGHRTNSGTISDADVTIVAQSADAVAGDQMGTVFDVNSEFGNLLVSNMEGGDVTVHASGSGGLLMNSTGRMSYESSNDLNLLSESHIFFAEDVLNRGAGNINTVAGWDPTKASLADALTGIISDIDMDTELFSVADAFGKDSSSVFVGSISNTGTIADGADTSVRVGSRTGQTNVVGYDVNVWASPTTGGFESGNRKYSGIGYEASDAGSGLDDVSGRIRVKAENDVSVISDKYALGAAGYTGWSGRDHSGMAAYAQIGHGGERNGVRNLNLSGEIMVEAGNDLIAKGGFTREAFAIVGHGGYDNPKDPSDSVVGGKITVDVGRDVDFEGGTGLWSFAQLGHGGKDNRLASFTESEISVMAGNDIIFKGGDIGNSGTTRTENYAMLGHGGSNSSILTAGGGYGGKIGVSAGGSVTVSGGVNSAGFAQIGHGGDATIGDHYGEICVVAVDGVFVGDGTTGGANAYSQIGHGGDQSPGDFDGDITVVATDGAVTIEGGSTSTGSYAQIGHGGTNNGGDMEGNIRVVAANGDLTLVGGEGASAYAMIGHGQTGSASSGTREGGIHIFSNGALIGSDGGGADSGARIIHQSGGGLSADDYLGGDGFQLVANGGTMLSDGALTGASTMVNENFGRGPVSVAFTNDIDLTIDAGQDLFVGTSDHFYLLTGGAITMLSSYQNSEDGNVTLVAGWDGSGVISAGGVSYTGGMFCEPVIDNGDVAPDFNNCDAFGANGSGITIGAADQSDPVFVGSREGTTSILGYGVELNASTTMSDRASQIGFRTDGSGAAIGSIQVGVKEDGLSLTSGADGAYTQIGHGGFGSDDELINAPITISFCEESDLELNGGDSSNAYSQIGHGGAVRGSTKMGQITIAGDGGFSGFALNSGSGTGAYTQVGHGGFESVGSTLGDILLTGAGASGGTGGIFALNGGAELAGPDFSDAYAQVGHGGYSAVGDHSGDITATGLGAVTLQGGGETDTRGADDRNYSQFGHGGYDADGAHDGRLEISSAGDLKLLGGDGGNSYAQIGHGGRDENVGANTGDILITTNTGGIHVVSGVGTVSANVHSYAQIGHGGTSANGDHRGDITIDSGDNLIFSINGDTGSRDNNYKLIGHGGRAVTGDFSGAINVTAVNNIDILGGTNDITFAQIGHGGAFSGGTSNADIVDSGALAGVNVTSTAGRVLVRGGLYNLDGDGETRAYAQIGLGGYLANGNYDADIHVSAETGVVIDGGGRDQNYALIGNGGNLSDGIKGGDIHVLSTTGNITVFGATNHELAGGQIGHGGFRAEGMASGDIDVSALAGGILIRNGGGDDTGDAASTQNPGADSFSYGRIGHGGAEGGDFVRSGDICVHGATEVSLISNRVGGKAFTQIGHGGHDTDGIFSGSVTVVSSAGGVVLTGGNGAEEGRYALIGHGGVDSDGAMSGNVTVVSGAGDTALTGGSADNSFAMIGHGDAARTSTGTRQGGIHLFSSGELKGTNGTGAGSEVYIFHQNDNGLQESDYLGGDGYQKVANAGIDVDSSAFVDENTMFAGNIGSGAITIIDRSDRDYEFDTGDVFLETSNDFTIITGGSITMLNSYQNSGTGGVTLVAGWNGEGMDTAGSVSYTGGMFCEPVIKDGGLSVDFNNCEAFGNGDATVTLGGPGQNDPVLVGSRGGTTQVAAHGLVLNASSGYTQLGFHSGGSGDINGEINVRLQDGGLELNSGTATNAYTMIGHGGTGSEADTVIDALIDISFCNPGDVLLEAGTGSGAYAQIGHGANSLASDRSGEIKLIGAKDITMNGKGTNAHAQIGHGGNRSSGLLAGKVTVDASGDILATGGSGEASLVQIGHGGRSAAGIIASEVGASGIMVSAGGNIVFQTGTTNYASAKVGHGGNLMEISSFADNPITLSAGGNVQFIAPQFTTFRSQSYASSQIGHGGVRSAVDGGASGYTGDIAVDAGGKIDLIAPSNSRTFNYSLIGHTAYFGTPGVHGGNITVKAGLVSGLADYGLTMKAASGDYNGSVDTSNGYYSFAAIGHRGHNPGFSATGDIDVDVIRGGITMTGGDGIVGSTAVGQPADIRLHPTQIGHGGYNVGSDGIDGFVKVYAQSDILLQTGNARLSPVNIGHGGYSVDGTIGKAGDVLEVVSREGNLELNTTGSDSTSTAFIGFGDSTSGTGARLGDILVDVAGEISLVTGSAVTWIGHRSNSIANYSDADVTIRAGSLDYAAGLSGTGLFHIGDTFGNMVASNLSGGQVSLIDMGDGGIWSDVTIRQDTDFDLNLLSTSHIFMAGDAINQGDGNVNLIAGWDPSIADLSPDSEVAPYRYYWVRDIDMDSDIFDLAGSFGNGDGSVWIGANHDLSGSDTGVVIASRTGETNVAGDDVNVWGGAVTGGFNAGERKYSQIGYNRLDGGTAEALAASGRIRVGATNDIEVEGNHYAVGTIGYNGWTDHDRTGQASFAQIGHGGERSSVHDMDLSGAIIIDAGGSLSVEGGTTINSHGKIGHGGYDNPDDNDGTNLAKLGGEITVTTGGNISFQAGAGYYAFSQLGHGGANHFLGDFTKSDITVTSGGNVNFTASPGNTTGNTLSQQGYAQLGHGGYGSDFIAIPGTADDSVPVSAGSGLGYQGDILLNATGTVTLTGGGGDDYNYSLIGNGGAFANGDHSGSVTVNAGSDVKVEAGDTGNYVFAHIGNMQFVSEGNLSGATTVTSTNGGVQVLGGDGLASYAQIGSGGYRPTGTVSDHVLVSAGGTGGVTVKGGDGTFSYGTIGNGGLQLNGAVTGNTTVNSTGSGMTDGLEVTGGEGRYASATVGHLSQGFDGNFSNGVLAGDVIVNVTNGGVKVQAGTDGYFSHAMIGHGGRDAGGNKGGAIRVSVTEGDVSVTGGDTSSAIQYTHAQIGHGGYGNGVVGDYSGSITVTALDGGIDFNGGNTYAAYAMLGHGGFAAGTGLDGTMSGDILVTASSDIEFTGGGERYSFAQLGHGGRGNDGSKGLVGDTLKVTSEMGSIRFMAGDGTLSNYAQLGHGGYISRGDTNVDITVNALQGGVHLTGGGDSGNYALLGNGGDSSSGAHTGAIVVNSGGGGINLSAGAGEAADAQIGNGGRDNDGNHSGMIHLTTQGDLALNGGIGSGESYAMVGHGGSTDLAAGEAKTAFATAESSLLTTGTRQGELLIDVGNGTILADNDGASFMGHLTPTGAEAGSNFALVTTTLNTGSSAAGITGTIRAMGSGGNVEIGVTGGDLEVNGSGGNYHSANHVDLVATGNVNVTASVQNGGSGAVNLASGWDTTLPGLNRSINTDNSPSISLLNIDFSSIMGTDTNYGVGEGSVSIDAGANRVAVGSANGATNVIGFGVDVIGTGSSAQIGFNEDVFDDATGRNGVATSGMVSVFTKDDGLDLTGAVGEARVGHGGLVAGGTMSGGILVDTTRGDVDGDVVLAAGAGFLSSASIGHGARNSGGAKSGDIVVDAGAVSLSNGSGDAASAQIGHSTSNSTLSGNITVGGSGAVDVLADGTGNSSFAMIGHGGGGARGNFSGNISVGSTESLTLSANDDVAGIFSKIGHGDDYTGDNLIFAGTGSRGGDIQIGAGGDVSILGTSLVGHVNAATLIASMGATTIASGSDTLVAPSRSDPESGTGSIIVGSGAGLSTADDGELRFYVPTKSQLRIAAGATLNGISFDGGSPDPASELRANEFVRNLVGISPATPNQHENLTPYYSSNAAAIAADMQMADVADYSRELGNFGFFFDTVNLIAAVPPVDPNADGAGMDGNGPLNFLDFFPEDSLNDDDQREFEEQFSRRGSVNFRYEGYDQYGPNGEPTFDFSNGNSLDIGLEGGVGFDSGIGSGNPNEDVLERQQRILEEEKEEDEEEAANVDGEEEVDDGEELVEVAFETPGI